LFFSLDFHRLRASNLKSGITTNDDNNTNEKKRKAQTSQVNNNNKKIFKIIILFRLKKQKNLQHQVQNVCDHLMRTQPMGMF